MQNVAWGPFITYVPNRPEILKNRTYIPFALSPASKILPQCTILTLKLPNIPFTYYEMREVSEGKKIDASSSNAMTKMARQVS